MRDLLMKGKRSILSDRFVVAWHNLASAGVITAYGGNKVALDAAFEGELLEEILARCLDYRYADEKVSSVIASIIVEALSERLEGTPPRGLELCSKIVFVLLSKITPVTGPAKIESTHV